MYDRNTWLRDASARRSRRYRLRLTVRKRQRLGETNLRRQRIVHQVVERRRADDGEHRLSLGVIRADVAGGEPCAHVNPGSALSLHEVGVARGVEQPVEL